MKKMLQTFYTLAIFVLLLTACNKDGTSSSLYPAKDYKYIKTAAPAGTPHFLYPIYRKALVQSRYSDSQYIKFVDENWNTVLDYKHYGGFSYVETRDGETVGVLFNPTGERPCYYDFKTKTQKPIPETTEFSSFQMFGYDRIVIYTRADNDETFTYAILDFNTFEVILKIEGERTADDYFVLGLINDEYFYIVKRDLYTIYDKNHNLVLALPNGYNIEHRIAHRPDTFYVRVGGDLGLMDITGNLIFEPKYSHLEDFVDGRALASLKKNEYFFIDESGIQISDTFSAKYAYYESGYYGLSAADKAAEDIMEGLKLNYTNFHDPYNIIHYNAKNKTKLNVMKNDYTLIFHDKSEKRLDVELAGGYSSSFNRSTFCIADKYFYVEKWFSSEKKVSDVYLDFRDDKYDVFDLKGALMFKDVLNIKTFNSECFFIQIGNHAGYMDMDLNWVFREPVYDISE